MFIFVLLVARERLLPGCLQFSILLCHPTLMDIPNGLFFFLWQMLGIRRGYALDKEACLTIEEQGTLGRTEEGGSLDSQGES